METSSTSGCLEALSTLRAPVRHPPIFRELGGDESSVLAWHAYLSVGWVSKCSLGCKPRPEGPHLLLLV